MFFLIRFYVFKQKKVRQINSDRLLTRNCNYGRFFYLIAVVSVEVVTTAESVATVSTATTVESAFGASSAFLGAQDAKAKANTQNKNTFFITLNL